MQSAVKAFWVSRAINVSSYEVKQRHTVERLEDRNLRWSVRKNVRDDGVQSNLFPLDLMGARTLSRYELKVTRQPRVASKNENLALSRSATTVSSTRAWRTFAQSLRKHIGPAAARTSAKSCVHYCSAPTASADASKGVL